jgi:hypothetical protein
MNDFIPESTYRRIFELIYSKKESGEIIKKWSQDYFESFSNADVRALYAKLFNPQKMKSVTFLMDGKDIITFMNLIDTSETTNNGFHKMLSRKNKKGGNWQKGIKLCVLFDIRGFVRNTTPIKGCLEKYDGHLAPELDLLDTIDIKDVVSADHHFDKFLRELFSTENEENMDREEPFTNENYLLKPVKQKNIPLNPDELERKNEISALLSKIESECNSMLSSKCKMFNGKSKKKWKNFEQIELMLLISFTMLGIDKMVKTFPKCFEEIETGFYAPNYEFPFEEISIESDQIITQNDSIEQQIENQDNFILEILRSGKYNEISSDEDDNIDNQYFTQENIQNDDNNTDSNYDYNNNQNEDENEIEENENQNEDEEEIEENENQNENEEEIEENENQNQTNDLNNEDEEIIENNNITTIENTPRINELRKIKKNFWAPKNIKRKIVSKKIIFTFPIEKK